MNNPVMYDLTIFISYCRIVQCSIILEFTTHSFCRVQKCVFFLHSIKSWRSLPCFLCLSPSVAAAEPSSMNAPRISMGSGNTIVEFFSADIAFRVWKKAKGYSKKQQPYIQRHCPSRREGGQPHFKTSKEMIFWQKLEREGVTKHIVKIRSTLFCMIYHSIWPNQGTFCTPDPQKVIGIIENVSLTA